MLTQCPGCQTVFRVTSTILRAAHGQVRCGRCNTQFDAIERLLDSEDEQADAAVTSKNLHVEQDAKYETAQLSHEEIVLEGNRIEISGVYRRAEDDAQASDADAEHTQTVIEEFNIGTEEWENPFDKQESTANDDDAETEVEDIEEELSAAALADAMASLDTSALAERHANAEADQVTLAGSDQATSGNDETIAANDDEPITAPVVSSHPLRTAPISIGDRAMRPTAPLLDLGDESLDEPAPRHWQWLLASTVLTLLLAGQALHHFRDTLARHPGFGPKLTQLYAAIGRPLAPQWQLQAYSIKQWGIVSDPQQAGTLRVRASVTNNASFAQPYPLLQLSLEDRFGSKVGTREFKPDEYLASNTQAGRLLAAGEAANIDLAIVDPGPDAVGFQFDTCLQLQSGLQCSHDAALKTH